MRGELGRRILTGDKPREESLGEEDCLFGECLWFRAGMMGPSVDSGRVFLGGLLGISIIPLERDLLILFLRGEGALADWGNS